MKLNVVVRTGTGAVVKSRLPHLKKRRDIDQKLETALSLTSCHDTADGHRCHRQLMVALRPEKGDRERHASDDADFDCALLEGHRGFDGGAGGSSLIGQEWRGNRSNEEQRKEEPQDQHARS
jgi:hypothetical protein